MQWSRSYVWARIAPKGAPLVLPWERELGNSGRGLVGAGFGFGLTGFLVL